MECGLPCVVIDGREGLIDQISQQNQKTAHQNSAHHWQHPGLNSMEVQHFLLSEWVDANCRPIHYGVIVDRKNGTMVARG
jgi:hypothetical protein